jgi:hypothetical protein
LVVTVAAPTNHPPPASSPASSVTATCSSREPINTGAGGRRGLQLRITGEGAAILRTARGGDHIMETTREADPGSP